MRGVKRKEYGKTIISHNDADIHRVKLPHSNVWPQYDLHVVRHDVVVYAMLTGDDLSRYLTKIE